MDFFLKYHHPPRTEKEREDLYGRIRWIAFWLDNVANVGGLNIGLESIVGLIPVFGKKAKATPLPTCCISFPHRFFLCHSLLMGVCSP
jgi:hypothetical protein